MTDTTRRGKLHTPVLAENLTESLLSRLWAKVDIRGDDDCWEWQAYRTRAGYGIIGFGNGRNIVATRVILATKLGELPADRSALHTCDNPSCCNPRHLFPGTYKDNAQDRSRKGRSMHGERHVTAKLTEDDVRAIRVAVAAGRSQRKVAAEYGINPRGVWNIKHRLIWAHVS